jgi:hypothetical protein
VGLDGGEGAGFQRELVGAGEVPSVDRTSTTSRPLVRASVSVSPARSRTCSVRPPPVPDWAVIENLL